MSVKAVMDICHVCGLPLAERGTVLLMSPEHPSQKARMKMSAAWNREIRTECGQMLGQAATWSVGVAGSYSTSPNARSPQAVELRRS
jgi:hypothetical protein